jgi:multiple sugar transport system ATP-binding protein
LTPQERDIAMVFQTYALYPHKRVRENLAFGLRMRRVAAAEVERRIGAAARILGLEGVLDRLPAELSGGQRQRVALGRAIVREPKAFLLDEPLSNLDARLRVETRTELARLHRRLGATMLYVTHDQEEAMTLGDRIAVMRAGRIEQIAPPIEVYRRPATSFVAGFVGSPSMNLMRGTMRRAGGFVEVQGKHFRFIGRIDHEEPPSGAEVLLGVRPQDLDLVVESDADARGRVEIVETLGSVLLVYVALGQEERVTLAVAPDRSIRPGEPIGLRFRPDAVHLFDARSGQRLN